MKEPELRAHREWIGYVEPVGLLVSAPALVNRNIIPRHKRFLDSPGSVSVNGDSRDLKKPKQKGMIRA